LANKKPSFDRPVSPIVNIVAGTLLAAISLWVIYSLIPNNINQISGENDISPSLFPNLTARFLLGLSLVLVILNGLKLRKRGISDVGGDGVWILLQTIVWFLMATLIYLFLPIAGFLIVSASLITLIAVTTQYRNYWMIAVLALLMPLITSHIVWLVFQVELP